MELYIIVYTSVTKVISFSILILSTCKAATITNKKINKLFSNLNLSGYEIFGDILYGVEISI